MIKRYLKRDNPWELLAFAALLLFAAVDLLVQKEPMFATPHVGRAGQYIEALSPEAAHIIGWVVAAIAGLFAGLYFYVRAGSSSIVAPRGE